MRKRNYDNRRGWSDDDDQMLINLFDQNISHKEIGAKLNKTPGSVTQRVGILRGIGRISKFIALGRKNEDFVKPVAAVDKIVRPCLGCREDFVSDGPHNHMCPRCRKTDHQAVIIGRAPAIKRFKSIKITLLEVKPFDKAPWAQQLAPYLPKWAWRVQGSNDASLIGGTNKDKSHALSEAQKAAGRITGDVKMDAHLRQYELKAS